MSAEERRGAAGEGSAASSSSGPRSADGPSPRPSRRSFSAEYKLAIVAEYENAPNGEKGAVLRREGLYSSHVIEWTRARDAGALISARSPTDSRPASSRRPEKRPKKSAETVELERLRARNAKLEADLLKTRTALDIMGKAHALLEQLSEDTFGSTVEGADNNMDSPELPAPWKKR
jgi:transposase-like protein